MAAPYILARTLLDAHTFAREELGLAKGHYRIATSPSSISGRRGTDLYLVPGYEKRYDRFAMAGALKYTRLNKIDVAKLRKSGAVPDGLEPAGEQLTLIDADEATRFFDLLEDVDNPLNAPQDEAPAKRIRRRRCEECGELVLPDEFEQHLAEHLPKGE